MKEVIFNSILFFCFLYVFVVVGNVLIHFLLNTLGV
jgi:hypothetical protein